MADQAHAASTAPAHAADWEKTYPGSRDTVRCVRQDVRAFLGGCPEVVADDAELVASELATNAIRHSLSGAAGGTYVVRVSHYATEKIPYVWVEVEDQGSPSWDGLLRPQPTHGLAVIGCSSSSMGSDIAAEGRRAVYARLEYSPDGTPLYGTTIVPDLPPDLDGIRN
jgi:anti-sigma regulatory factor (Ser/Thr protein kinase)